MGREQARLIDYLTVNQTKMHPPRCRHQPHHARTIGGLSADFGPSTRPIASLSSPTPSTSDTSTPRRSDDTAVMGTLGTKRRGLSSFLYHTSFSLFILILAALLVGAAWGLGEQAAKSSHASRWNLFALCVAFAALVSIYLLLLDPCVEIHLDARLRTGIRDSSAAALVGHWTSAGWNTRCLPGRLEGKEQDTANVNGVPADIRYSSR